MELFKEPELSWKNVFKTKPIFLGSNVNKNGTFSHRLLVKNFHCWIPISIGNFTAKTTAGKTFNRQDHKHDWQLLN